MSRSFSFIQTSLSGVWVAQRNLFEDHRGVFGKMFAAGDFNELGLQKPLAQVNYSQTRRKGAVRGLHFQFPPHAETRVVSCLKGEVFDVAVDLRQGSPTFLAWHAEILSPGNKKSLVIPEGFAHGFQTMTDDCELLYFHTGIYAPESEGGIFVEDQRIGIKWPLPVEGLSPRDSQLHRLQDDYQGILL